MLRSPTRPSFPRSASITPPPSPNSQRTPGPGQRLSRRVSGVFSTLVNLHRSSSSSSSSSSGSGSTSSSGWRPYSRTRTTLCSGAPKSHPGVAAGRRGDAGTVPVEYAEQYVCKGGVNVATLLRATRLALLEHCHHIGANALVDEEWECRISGPGPKAAPNGAYKVDIVYTAGATRSTAADPRNPVHLEKVQNIPGLMTIVRRKNE